MAALRIFIGILALGAAAQAWSTVLRDASSTKADNVFVSLEQSQAGGFLLSLVEGNVKNTLAHIGRTLVSTFAVTDVEGGVEIQINGVTLHIFTLYDEDKDARGIKIKWDVANNSMTLEDCIDFGTKHWYAGPMQLEQVYPIEQVKRQYSAYITKEQDNGAVMERYWLNSAGEYIYVYPDVPLFVDYGNLETDHICFGAQVRDPYSTKRNHTNLAYDMWFLKDAKEAHKHAVENYLGKPSATPDFRMVQHPIWSTWAQFGKDINDTALLEFAQDINDHGFNNSQFEIDDLWETCYGSLTVDEERFPDMAGFVQKIKAMGYRVTIWVHPFINKGCNPWYSEALEKGYFVLTENGSPDTSWWDSGSNEAAYIDFTNQEAADWWHDRVKALIDANGIDSLKFDAGESSFSPQVPIQNGDIDFHPLHITAAYARTCARFGSMIEVRVGARTQDLPVFVRMVDRDSIWGLNNGLSTVITTTLQMTLNGYLFVLPDMIGGNGFQLNHEQAELPTKELFIRWVQANTFLAAMQFSFVPWNFDEETTQITKKYVELHAAYADKIYTAMQKAVQEGTPVNAPLWWADPTDNETFTIWDEFLLGEDILVAPVLAANTYSRDIYLPKGTWLESGNASKIHQGPIWLKEYDTPLDALHFFVRDGTSGSGKAPGLAGVLVLLVVAFVYGL